MTFHAWQVLTWPRAFFTPTQWRAFVSRTRLLEASRIDADASQNCSEGIALWGLIEPERKVGMAWDWREVKRGVLALSDPMRIVSNVMLVDSEGKCMPQSARLLHLNNAIASLCWQPAVMRAESEVVHH
jgi:hypothetical protein